MNLFHYSYTTPCLILVSLPSTMGTSRGSLSAKVMAGRMMGSCSYPGQKQEVKWKIFQLCSAPLIRQWAELKTRHDQPSQDWIVRNSRQERELDTEGREVIPRITARANSSIHEENFIPFPGWCSVNPPEKIKTAMNTCREKHQQTKLLPHLHPPVQPARKL